MYRKKKQTSWQVVLALDKNPFIIATTTNEEKYQFKILEDSKFSEPQNLFDDLKFAANQYLMVSQCGLDLLVNRLVPDTPEFRSEKNDWIAYDGLEAAKNILHTRMIEDRKLA